MFFEWHDCGVGFLNQKPFDWTVTYREPKFNTDAGNDPIKFEPGV